MVYLTDVQTHFKIKSEKKTFWLKFHSHCTKPVSKHTINSVLCSDDVLHNISDHTSVVSVFESKMNKLHTTHSWDFLGLDTVYKNNPSALDSASNVIVGVIDSGNHFLS